MSDFVIGQKVRVSECANVLPEDEWARGHIGTVVETGEGWVGVTIQGDDDIMFAFHDDEVELVSS